MTSSTAKRFVICHCGGVVTPIQSHIQLFRNALIESGFIGDEHETFIEITTEEFLDPTIDFNVFPKDKILLINYKHQPAVTGGELIITQADGKFVKFKDRMVEILRTHRVILFQQDGYLPSHGFGFYADHIFQFVATGAIIDLRQYYYHQLKNYRSNEISAGLPTQPIYTLDQIAEFVDTQGINIESLCFHEQGQAPIVLSSVEDLKETAKNLKCYCRLIIRWKNVCVYHYNIYNYTSKRGKRVFEQLSGMAHPETDQTI